MFFIRALRKRGLLPVIILPCALSALYAYTRKLPILALYVGSLLLEPACVPCFHRRENLSVSALLALSSVPVNVLLAVRLARTEFLDFLTDGVAVVELLVAMVIYALVFSLEQIVMGVTVRLIWRRQMAAPADMQ